MNSSNAGWMDTVLNALRSPGAMMVALVLALFPQGEHTAQVFLYFSHDRSNNAQLFAYAFAAAVEVAVLLFVLAGHKRISYLFAGASFLTNLVYYAIGGVAMLSVAVLPVLLLSALLPACIMGYSHTIAEKPKSDAPHGATPPANAPAKPRRYRWQFWRKPAETSTAQPTSNTTTPAPIAPPSPSGGHSEGVAQTGTAAAQPEGDGDKLTPAQRRAQIASAGLQTSEEVIAMFGVGKRTADGDLAWVRKNLLQTNGTGAR